AAGTIFLLGLTPINFFLTTVIAGVLALSGYLLLKQAEEPEVDEVEEEVQTESSAMKTSENVVSLINMDPIEFEFGYALIPL
ncbi:FHIPEP family type III secretion protein, partial [Planococcus sp. SIMBA_143]